MDHPCGMIMIMLTSACAGTDAAPVASPGQADPDAVILDDTEAGKPGGRKKDKQKRKSRTTECSAQGDATDTLVQDDKGSSSMPTAGKRPLQGQMWAP